jgi:hypothetical protein
MTRRLFLHVGIPKTGSTSMQKWFFDNIHALKTLGVTYPIDPPLHNYKQGYTASDLRGNSKIASIKAALAGANTPDIILSNEGMANHFHDFPDENLAEFRKATADFQVIVLLFHRDQDRWLRSYHRQAVLNPKNNASELWGTSQSADEIRSHYRVERLLDHQKMAADMKVSYGAHAVHALDFDAPDAFVKMLRVMGLQDLEHIELPRINQAIPEWAINMMRRINAQVPDNPTRQTWKALLFYFLASNHTVLRDDAQSRTADDVGKIDPNLLNNMPSDVPVDAIKSFIGSDLLGHFQKTSA